jgi:hypothetical protein
MIQLACGSGHGGTSTFSCWVLCETMVHVYAEFLRQSRAYRHTVKASCLCGVGRPAGWSFIMAPCPCSELELSDRIAHQHAYTHTPLRNASPQDSPTPRRRSPPSTSNPALPTHRKHRPTLPPTTATTACQLACAMTARPDTGHVLVPYLRHRPGVLYAPAYPSFLCARASNEHGPGRGRCHCFGDSAGSWFGAMGKGGEGSWPRWVSGEVRVEGCEALS